MPLALINPAAAVLNLQGQPFGVRILEVREASVPVAPPLYWLEAPAEVTPQDWCYASGIFQLIPRATISTEAALENWRTATSATRFQARAALYQTLDDEDVRLFDKVELIMANPATPTLYRMAWEDALEFRRLSPTVLALGSMLGLSDAQLDELFVLAKTIEA
jgi:hypothetical protein